MNQAPPLPSSPTARIFRAFAQFSWAAVIFALASSAVVQAAAGSLGAARVRQTLLVLSTTWVLVGVGSGIAALAGVRRYGRKGILWPALVGLALWAGLLGLAIPSLRAARARAQEAAKVTALAPVVHIPSATPLRDAELRFSLDVPPGFEPQSGQRPDPKMKHVFLRPDSEGVPRVLIVSGLGGTLPRKRMQAQDLPKGSMATLLSFNWRGVEVDAFRVPEQMGETVFLTFNVQLPLRPQAIQLGVGGPAEAEDEIRAMVQQVLASLDGESTW